LVGRAATLANLDFNAQYFPYDVLHICSHGGEVDGYEMSERFTDSTGTPHFVEFEEVVGFTPAESDPAKVRVHRKVFPRKLDGFVWMSPELKKQNFPTELISAMWKCMLESQGQRKSKNRIAMSCAIACSDSIHQGQFDALASYSSPVIFNNTCWSWYEVALFFLGCGARGYIGTLWAIDNEAAVLASKSFYEHLYSGSILNAFQTALKAIDTTKCKDIYVYWGLHFSTLPPGKNVGISRMDIARELIRAVDSWSRVIETTKSAEVKRNSIRVLRSILTELVTNFDSPELRQLEAKTRKKFPLMLATGNTRNTHEHEFLNNYVPSRECPVEYKELEK
jgi:hypothetical protein